MQWEIEMVKTATYVFSYISAGSVAADDFQVEQFLSIGYQWLFVIITVDKPLSLSQAIDIIANFDFFWQADRQTDTVRYRSDYLSLKNRI